MDTIMAWFGITLALLVVCWICYSRLTSSIIKDQEREIRKLENENRKLKAAIRGLENIKMMPNKLYASPEKPNIVIVRHADRHSTTSGNDELFGEW